MASTTVALLFWTYLGVGTCTGDSCRLSHVLMRSTADPAGNAAPIDLLPVKDDPRRFEAWLDFAMDGFSVTAIAEPVVHCEATIVGRPSQLLDPGARMEIEVDVHRNDDSSASDIYRVSVQRLTGHETSIMSLQVADAYLVPTFSPDKRNYTAYLDVSQDQIRITFQQLDSGQSVFLDSQLEVAPSSEAGSAIPFRLLSELAGSGMPSDTVVNGEAQRPRMVLTAPIDVGRARVATLTVRSADGITVGGYTLIARRPFCPEERRFFDAAARACTDTCEEGYFGNPSTGRCTECLVDRCAVCDSGMGCSRCRASFVLQSADVCVGSAFGAIEARMEASESYGLSHPVIVLAYVAAAVSALACSWWLVSACSGASDRSYGPCSVCDNESELSEAGASTGRLLDDEDDF